MPRDDAAELPEDVRDYCRSHDLGEVVGSAVLHGGMISTTRRLTTSSGTSLVLKEARDAPPALYLREAEGLRRIHAARFLRVPHVVLATEHLLLLEDLGSQEIDDSAWSSLGHRLALQHVHCTNTLFGFDHDNYLGRLSQYNPWTEDGHAFFAQHRLLRYLSEPLVEKTLSADDRRGLERIAARLPQLIPTQPPSLLHGDLWFANVVGSPGRGAAVVDPAVYFGWPEAELSMIWSSGRVPQGFYDAYREVYPLEPGSEERFEILHLRERLSVIAHIGNLTGTLETLRSTVSRWR